MGRSRGRLISTVDRPQALTLINEACNSGARKKKACELLGISLRTVERWEHTNNASDKRKGAKKNVANKLTKEEQENILSLANSEEYRDLPPCKIVPMLADKKIYIASESSFYRVLRAANQLTHRQSSKEAKHKKPKSCVAYGPNQVWSWDISYLPTKTRGLYYYLYFMLDIFSRKIVGWSIHETESSDFAAKLIKQACIDENIKEEQLTLHSDNGSPMKGITMLAMLETLGVISSFSRPSVSDDNPYSESLFRTTKYHHSFPKDRAFDTIHSARNWCERFVLWYNKEHFHSALKFITPEQRHLGLDKSILDNRHAVYVNAKMQHPERWSGNTRNWLLPNFVSLNPDRKNKIASFNKKEMAME